MNYKPGDREAGPALTVGLHGLSLTFRSADQALLHTFEQIYGHLPRPPESARSDILVQWRLHPAPTAPPPPDLPLIAGDDPVRYYGDGSRVVIRMPKYGLIDIDLAKDHLSGRVTQSCLQVYGAFEDMLMISLAPLYRRRGWFPLHAFAALAPGGQAALISGRMGAGKTTTGLALLQAGWKLLSNDSPLLTLRNGRVQVLAYPGRLSAFDDSLARFDRLRRFIPARPDRAGAKRVFRAEEAFDSPWAASGPAGGLFLPQVVRGLARSELEPISAAQAVLALMPQAIEGWDKEAIGRSLALVSKLVRQVPCYSLKLGPDVEQLPALIAGGMASQETAGNRN